MNKIKTIFWDFDGVILDSQEIRVHGFREIFKGFDESLVDKLIEYHLKNGGLSRFHKIEYFFNEILKQEINEEGVQKYAKEFRAIMKKELINKEFLIKDSITFIQNNYTNYNFHIISGAEESELRFLCEKLDISKYFISIHGSPTKKVQLIQNLLDAHGYEKSECVMIGDSIHDYHAASKNGIDFYGYNNEELKDVSKIYVISFY